MTIEYTDSLDGITPEMLQGFFHGWKKPHSPEAHLRILQGSSYVVLAIDGAAGRVVGHVTALTDGNQAAFIPLLEVLSDYQKQGIGSELMKLMLERLKGIPAIDLMCDAEMQAFYARFGMHRSVGMVIRDY